MKRFVVISLVAACGGSTINSSNDGGDAGLDAPLVIDDGVSDVIGPPTQLYDGVVGKTCTTNADCATAHGPNVAVCSNTVFKGEDFFPTAVCVLPSCSPVSDKTSIHYCDGPPDDPNSPGLCVPSGGASICLPKCTYDKAGGAPKGCVGKDACNAYPITASAGVGYCFGGCTQDSDCQDGQKCQTDRGWCLPGVTPPTKPVGATCTTSDSSSLACNCLYGTNNTGYCSQFCTIGGAACPNGYTCDSLELRLSGYTTPNVGMAGYCTLACSADAGTCPSTATCTNAFASGPDCIPP